MSLLSVAGCRASCSGAMYCGVPAWIASGIVGGDGQAEIGDADVAFAVEHHVGGFQVAMEHPALVRGGEAGAELARDIDGFVLRNAADPAKQRREILAVDVLHREESAAVRFAEVVQPADVLVRHLPRDPQLVVELRERARFVGRDGVGQEFQRDGLVERQVLGAIDFSHAAAAEQRHQAIAPGDNGSRSEAAPTPAFARCRESSLDAWPQSIGPMVAPSSGVASRSEPGDRNDPIRLGTSEF